MPALAALLLLGAILDARLAPDHPFPIVPVGEPLVLEIVADAATIVDATVRLDGVLSGATYEQSVEQVALDGRGPHWLVLHGFPESVDQYRGSITVQQSGSTQAPEDQFAATITQIGMGPAPPWLSVLADETESGALRTRALAYALGREPVEEPDQPANDRHRWLRVTAKRAPYTTVQAALQTRDQHAYALDVRLPELAQLDPAQRASIAIEALAAGADSMQIPASALHDDAPTPLLLTLLSMQSLAGAAQVYEQPALALPEGGWAWRLGLHWVACTAEPLPEGREVAWIRDAAGNPVEAWDNVAFCDAAPFAWCGGNAWHVLLPEIRNEAQRLAAATLSDSVFRSLQLDELELLLHTFAAGDQGSFPRPAFLELAQSLVAIEQVSLRKPERRGTALALCGRVTILLLAIASLKQAEGDAFVEPLDTRIARCRRLLADFRDRSGASVPSRVRQIAAIAADLLARAERLQSGGLSIEASAVSVAAEWRARSLEVHAMDSPPPER